MEAWKPDLEPAEVTPKWAFLNRREILAGLASLGLASGGARAAMAAELKPNSLADITGFNNFAELGMGKRSPAENAHLLTTEPWTVKVDGLVENPGQYSLKELLSGTKAEERIYRFRCVEAWSMVVPWNGIELRTILDKLGVKEGARYVAFETLFRPEEMPGQRRRTLNWPYREALRLDEAMNPLSLMATGLYGDPLPAQNGAPFRLVVPWKYGFKSIKSVVRISLLRGRPETTWNLLQPDEYGFFANVNPAVDHPRWNQSTERRIGGGLFARRTPTLFLNGYADQVAHLYDGMDLEKNF
jgi:sulfoxide reductase catalytic subunit YedY